MYIQMGVIGVLLAAILYVGGMSLFIKHFISSPIPELQYIEGAPRLILKSNADDCGLCRL
jgi:hypothetical protein